ncbi:MAG: ERCC4 domain-containing protein [Actinomycetota bacterium]
MGEPRVFRVGLNPEEGSSLPYLLELPVDGGVILKAREPWPTSSRVYCHPWEGPWPKEAEIVEEVPVRRCVRRGPAIDLVLERGSKNRAQFVFTEVRARPAIFWQTRKVARAARPGVRVPSRRASGFDALLIEVDTRERYPYKFSGRRVETTRVALPAGDYAVQAGNRIVAAVERKTEENLAASLSDGSLGFVMGELASLPAAAVVVEGRYSSLFKVPKVTPGWLPEVLSGLQVRYPGAPIVFCENRKLAEEYTYRFLAAALRDLGQGPGTAEGPNA